MADNTFTPITLNTQEEVNQFFGERARHVRSATRAEVEAEFTQKYAGFDDYKAKAEKYDADIKALEEKITGLEGEKSTSTAKISELEEKVRAYETNSVKMRIARESGLPAELADRLNGKDEAAMRADAEALAKLLKMQQSPAPMYHPQKEGGSGNSNDQYLKDMLSNLRPTN